MTIAERRSSGKREDTPSNEDELINAARRKKSWERIPRDALLIAILVLASVGSFGIGVLAGRESGEGKGDDGFWIEKLGQEVTSSAATAEATESAIIEVSQKAPSAKASPSVKKPPPPATGGQYVASKTGTKYYLPWCGSVKRIKEENKVWFATKAEAEAAGYGPAKNCKGI